MLLKSPCSSHVYVLAPGAAVMEYPFGVVRGVCRRRQRSFVAVRIAFPR